MSEKRVRRVRRGREVEIPEEWRGVVTHRQTIRKRQSKLSTKKLRRRMKWRYGAGRSVEAQEARAPQIEEWL